MIKAADSKIIADEFNKTNIDDITLQIEHDISGQAKCGGYSITYYGSKNSEKAKAAKHLIEAGYEVDISDNQRDGWSMCIQWGKK